MTPLKTTFWGRIDGSVDVGSSFALANHLSQFNTAVGRHLPGTQVLSGAQCQLDTDPPGQRPRHAPSELGLAYAHFFEHRWQGQGALRFERNDQLGLDLRASADGGVLPFLVQTNSTLLDAAAGLSGNREIRVDGSSSYNFEGIITMDYSNFVYDSPKVSADAYLRLYPSLSDWGRLRLEASAVAKRELVKDLFVGLNGVESYDNKPPEGATNTDWNVYLSLGWTFCGCPTGDGLGSPDPQVAMLDAGSLRSGGEMDRGRRSIGRMSWLIAVALCAATLSLPVAWGAGKEAAPATVEAPTANAALAQLVEGNQRFVAGKPTRARQSATYRSGLTTSQHPFVTILGCSDSRALATRRISTMNRTTRISTSSCGNRVSAPGSSPSIRRSPAPPRRTPALRGRPCFAQPHSIPSHSSAGWSPHPPNGIRSRMSSPLMLSRRPPAEPGVQTHRPVAFRALPLRPLPLPSSPKPATASGEHPAAQRRPCCCSSLRLETLRLLPPSAPHIAARRVPCR